jgi:hypothetical protein
VHGDEIMRIHVSQPRRAIGLGVLGGMGIAVLYLAFAVPTTTIALLFLLAIGFSALWLAVRMWQASSVTLILTESGLYESTGREIARLDGIRRIERGVFAIKPSNGFALVLDAPGSRVWVPGVWWRLGRRVAVGGVLSARDTKPVADILMAKLATRDAG